MAHGASTETDELLAYNHNTFDHGDVPPDVTFPLPDEPFVAAWERYMAALARQAVLDVLKKPLVQLNFPIRAGISKEPQYLAVMRRGAPLERCALATGLPLNRPAEVSLAIRDTPAGRIALITVEDREDFENIVRALTMRNEPGPVPPSMGASMVSGFNNWERIHRYRSEWSAAAPSARGADDWQAEFQRLIPRRELYQDRFIIVSTGPYSGVSANNVNLSSDEWARLSVSIRIGHECTHYFTKRVLASMRNNVMDEIIADYVGIVEATGRFRADWFRRFMGLQAFPRYTPGGRLENYLGDPPLTDAAFNVVQALVNSAAQNLEKSNSFMLAHKWTPQRAGQLILALTRLTLEQLAGPEEHLRAALMRPAL